MRLPISRVYRAFPELDRFDDARCKAYVRTVRREQGSKGVAVELLNWLVGGAAGLAMLCAVVSFLQMFAKAGSGPSYAARVASLCTVVGVPVMAGGLTSLALRDRRLRRLIRRQIEGGRCPVCSYLLLGLVPREGLVRCPECGTSHRLTELG
ncbi:MAG: hypothetical protein ACK4WH_04490 [Phycisphaerales bacterium]